MKMKIRSPLTFWGLSMMLFSIFFVLLFFGVLFIAGLEDVLFSPGVLLPILIYFALMLVFGIAVLALGWHRKRKLARLRTVGAAYEAGSIARVPAHIFGIPGHINIRVNVAYADSKGVIHTTKGRQYAISSSFGAVRLNSLELSATVYVNPDNSQDYAVDLQAERRW